MSNSYELNCRYDRRRSFYGKAHVREEGGCTILRSYSTDVAYIKDGKAYVKGAYSNTTLRHIKEFLKQHGFEAEKQSQILKDYAVDREGSEPGPEPLGQQFKAVNMVCAIGKLLCPDQKEKNKWDKRMLKTIPGIQFPDDWDQLPEEEKQRRLEGAREQIK